METNRLGTGRGNPAAGRRNGSSVPDGDAPAHARGRDGGTVHRLLALFGADSGIGTVNGEPVTFDRQGGPPSRLVKLTIYDRHNRLLTSLELAVSTDDYLELNRKGLKGALFLQQGPEQEQILEFDLALTLDDGETVTLGNIGILEPGRRYTAQEMGFRIEKRLLKI